MSTALICAAVLFSAHTVPAAGVVGTGIAAGYTYTDAALNTALANRGLMTFNRGHAPVTIDTQEAPIVIRVAASLGTPATETAGVGQLESTRQSVAASPDASATKAAGEGWLEWARQLVAAKGLPFIVALVLVLVYLLGILFVRAFWVVRPNDTNLRGEIVRVRASLGLEQENPTHWTELEKIIAREIRKILQEAENLFEAVDRDARGHHARKIGWLRSIVRELFSRAGNQNAAWRRIHDAQCLAVDIYANDVVKTHAVFACAELEAIESKGAGAVAEALQKELKKGDQKDWGRLKALLKEAAQNLYERRDESFEHLEEWNNKGLWLVAAAALLVLCLTTMGNSQLLLLGSVGGLLGKLRGIVKQRSIPYDYGVSWTTLFLTPLVGALTGWVGVLLLPFFVQLTLLGAFFNIEWAGATKPEGLALAVFFGLGATYFDKLLESAQKQGESKQPSNASEGA